MKKKGFEVKKSFIEFSILLEKFVGIFLRFKSYANDFDFCNPLRSILVENPLEA